MVFFERCVKSVSLIGDSVDRTAETQGQFRLDKIYELEYTNCETKQSHIRNLSGFRCVKGADSMLTFLINNAGTIVTALVLAAVVFLVVRSMARDRKAGRGGCSGCCGTCRTCGGDCAVPPVKGTTRNR